MVIVPAVAAKVVEVRPPGTVTDAGTVRAAELLDSETPTPPDGAAWFSDTVQVEVPPVLNAPGMQESPASVGPELMLAVIVPPVPLVGIAVPLGEAPSVLVTAMAVDGTLEAIVTVTEATEPLEITVSLSPTTRQAYEPTRPAQ